MSDFENATLAVLGKKTTEVKLGNGTFRIRSLGIIKQIELAEVKEAHRQAVKVEQDKAIKKLQGLVRKAKSKDKEGESDNPQELLNDALESLARQAVLLDIDSSAVVSERDRAILKLYRPYCDKLVKFINPFKIEGEDITGKELFENYDLKDVNTLIVILETGAPPKLEKEMPPKDADPNA